MHSSSSVARFGAGLMLALWLATLLAFISPAVHHLLHQDSQSQRHDCVVTHVSKGQVLSEIPATLFLEGGPVVAECCAPASVFFSSCHDYRLLPCRAPPAVVL